MKSKFAAYFAAKKLGKDEREVKADPAMEKKEAKAGALAVKFAEKLKLKKK